jgi:hypothetical protein
MRGRATMMAGLGLVLIAAEGGWAQGGRTPAASCLRQPAAAAPARADHAPAPNERAFDVVLDVPNLCVDRLQLGVRNLEVNVALDARVANLVEISAGADVSIARVDLGLFGVQAQALLLVDLDDVYQVVDRTLTFIDNNPQIVRSLSGTVNNAVGTAGRVANTALQPGGVVSQTVGTVGQTLGNVTAPGGLLSQTVSTAGQTVQRVVTPAGQILEQTLGTAGQVANSRTIGSVLSLPVVSETAGSAGGVVRQVRDQTGRIIEVTLDRAGQVTATRVLQGATRP